MATKPEMSEAPEWVKAYWEKSLELSSTQARIIEELKAKLAKENGGRVVKLVEEMD